MTTLKKNRKSDDYASMRIFVSSAHPLKNGAAGPKGHPFPDDARRGPSSSFYQKSAAPSPARTRGFPSGRPA